MVKIPALKDSTRRDRGKSRKRILLLLWLMVDSKLGCR